jgi:ABC-type oligopeptide transport system substrate-binding subunit
MSAGALVSLPAVAAFLEACSPTPATTQAPGSVNPSAVASQAPSVAPSAAAEVSDFGATYPGDAAAKRFQFIQEAINNTGTGWKSMDHQEMNYAIHPSQGGYFSEPLVRVTNEYQVVPGTASKWEVSADGLSWTFTIDKGQMWSNGDEVTGEDYVASFIYTADPKHAWDFTFFWDGVIKNYGPATRGEKPNTDIGVKLGADKYQVVFTTEAPTPYLPTMLLYSWPLNRTALKQFGSGVYNLDPKTVVSSGPFILDEWSPDRRVVLKANPKYTGKLKPLINSRVANTVTGGSALARYRAGEVDYVLAADLGGPDLKDALADPALASQVKINPGDFRTFYTFFDITKKPFDNVKVRMAFAKAIDREAIVKGILAPMALPAYSFLAPGFPDSNSKGLQPIQAFDPAAAKQLLSDAGYPNGAGFPKLTMIVRGGGPSTDAAVTQAVVASITQTLGIQADLQTMDRPAFSKALNAKPTQIAWGYVSYGYDYLDASNMLGVWHTGGRHNYNNATYDKMVADASVITNDPAKRSQMMQDAEKLLVTDAPGAFIYHELQAQLHKPYRKGAYLNVPSKAGYTGIYSAGEGTGSTALNEMYYSKEVETTRKS